MTDISTIAHPAAGTYRRDELFIDGEFVAPVGRHRIDVIDATTEVAIGSIPAGAAGDLDRALDAARRALVGFAASDPEERATVLERIAEGLEARQEELACLIAAEVGTPLRIARAVQVGLPIKVLRESAELLRSFKFEHEIANSIIRREPVGVVGALTPWNYPLHQIVAKLAPALAAGCTVVLKPSEVAPLNAFVLAEVFAEAELPRGVFNLVSGVGADLGDALVIHKALDMISFTGSGPVGAHLGALAMGLVKRVALELGGKSANVILPDADLERAVPAGVNSAFLNSGQTCNALTRMLVPVASLDEVLDLAQAATSRLLLGDPLEESTRLGPLVSAARRDAVRAHLEGARRDGAKVVTGGVEAPENLERGYFFSPTVLSEVTAGMAIANEEVFGPVLCVMTYRDEDEAIELANSTEYGLAGAVWSADLDHATAVARRLQCGQVDVNGGRFNSLAPFGGYKRSGVGRELGWHGIEEFTEIKSIQR